MDRRSRLVQLPWYQCDSAGAACVGVAGGTGAVYTARNEDVGHTIRVRVHAKNPKGTGSATSGPTDLIAQPTGTTATVPVTSVSLPNQLIVGGNQFVPSVINSTAPFVVRFKVTESKGRTVSGASSMPDRAARRAHPPRRRGHDRRGRHCDDHVHADGETAEEWRDPVLVRARKPGNNPLAGISSRHLVQVKVHR